MQMTVIITDGKIKEVGVYYKKLLKKIAKQLENKNRENKYT